MLAKRYLILSAATALALYPMALLASDSNTSNTAEQNSSKAQIPVLVDALWAHYDNNVTTAGGGVNASGNNYFITSDNAVYDQNRSLVELKGNVFALDGSQNYLMCDYAKILTDEKKGYFKPFFGKNMTDGMWTASADANASDGFYYINGAVSSS